MFILSYQKRETDFEIGIKHETNFNPKEELNMYLILKERLNTKLKN